MGPRWLILRNFMWTAAVVFPGAPNETRRESLPELGAPLRRFHGCNVGDLYSRLGVGDVVASTTC